MSNNPYNDNFQSGGYFFDLQRPQHCKERKFQRSFQVAELRSKPMSNTSIQALLVVNDIKRAFSNCYNCYLNNVKEGFNEDVAINHFYRDVANSVNDILCKAYGDDYIKENDND